MHISRAHIVVAMVVMGVVVAMIMSVTVGMIVLEDEGAHQIHAQPDAGDQQRFAIRDLGGMNQPGDGFAGNRDGGEPQHDGAGKRRQVAELARTETETRIGGMAPCQPVGARCQAQCSDMGRHVHAIGQKRHGMENEARADLHHHEDGRDQRRQLGARLRPVMAVAQKDMAVGPDAVAVRVGVAGMSMIVRHDRECNPRPRRVGTPWRSLELEPRPGKA